MNINDATFAIYRDQGEIKIALQSLKKLGFIKTAMSVYQTKKYGSKDFPQVQKFQYIYSSIIGSVIGIFIASGFFIFAKVDYVGSRFIFIILGIFFGGLLGAAGGLLVGIGTPDPAAKRYGQYLQSGGILLSVHCNTPKQFQQAQEVLSSTGGQDIQVINEIKTWRNANIERIDLENLQSRIS